MDAFIIVLENHDDLRVEMSECSNFSVVTDSHSKCGQIDSKFINSVTDSAGEIDSTCGDVEASSDLSYNHCDKDYHALMCELNSNKSLSYVKEFMDTKPYHVRSAKISRDWNSLEKSDITNINNNALVDMMKPATIKKFEKKASVCVSSLTQMCVDYIKPHITLCIDNAFISECEERSVVNLSSHVLTDAQLKLLKHGLTFCPTPGEPNMADLKRDLDTSLKCQTKGTF